MMNNYLTIVCILAFFYSWGQNVTGAKIVNQQPDYIARVSFSLNNSHYVLAHGSSGVTLLDSTFKVIKEIKYNANWGGCGGVFSSDGKSLAIVKSGDADTLVIYSLINNDSISLTGSFNNLLSLKKSNKLLIDAYDGSFSIFDFTTGVLQKNVIIPIKETRPYGIHFDVWKDSLLYLVLANKAIEVYNLSTYKKEKTLIKFEIEPYDIKISISGKFIAYSKDELIYIHNTNDGSLICKKNCKTGMVIDFEFAKDDELILIGGQKGKLMSLNLKTLKLKKIVKVGNKEAIDDICIDNKNEVLLIGTDTKLLSYKILSKLK